MNNYYNPPFNASFGDKDDLLKIGKSITINKNYKEGGFILWSDTQKAIILTSDKHNIVFGASGSGKTRRIAVQNVLIMSDSKDKESIIANFPKGPEVDCVYNHLKERGYRIIVINFRDPRCSDSWNPYDAVTEYLIEGEEEKAREMLNEINESVVHPYLNSNDPYWRQQVSKYINSLYMALAVLTDIDKTVLNFSNIISLHRFLDEKPRRATKLITLLREKGRNDVANGVAGVWENASDTRKNLINMAELAFSVLDGISAITYKSSFSTEDLVEKPCALFFVTPDESSTYDSCVSLYIHIIYSMLIKLASKSDNAELSRRVNFIIDEFSNLPKMKDINNKISASRSRRIRFSLLCQSYSQLVSKYSEEEADNILNNCATITCLQGKDVKLEAYLRAETGTKTLRHSNISVPLITEGILRGMEIGDAIILPNGMSPVKINYPDISEYSYDYSPSGYLMKERKSDIKLLDWEKEIVNSEPEEKEPASLSKEAIAEKMLKDMKEREAFITDINRVRKHPFFITERLPYIDKKPYDIMIKEIQFGKEYKTVKALSKILHKSEADIIPLVNSIYDDGDDVLIRCQNEIQYFEAHELLEDICRLVVYYPDGKSGSGSPSSFRHNPFGGLPDDRDLFR